MTNTINTWKQFREAQIRRIQESCTEQGYRPTLAECAECVGRNSPYYRQWWDDVEAAAGAGTVFSKRFLNGLERHERWTLGKFYPGCFPEGYVLPEYR